MFIRGGISHPTQPASSRPAAGQQPAHAQDFFVERSNIRMLATIIHPCDSRAKLLACLISCAKQEALLFASFSFSALKHFYSPDWLNGLVNGGTPKSRHNRLMNAFGRTRIGYFYLILCRCDVTTRDDVTVKLARSRHQYYCHNATQTASVFTRPSCRPLGFERRRGVTSRWDPPKMVQCLDLFLDSTRRVLRRKTTIYSRSGESHELRIASMSNGASAHVHGLGQSCTLETVFVGEGVSYVHSQMAGYTFRHGPCIWFEQTFLDRSRGSMVSAVDRCEYVCVKLRASYRDYEHKCPLKHSRLTEGLVLSHLTARRWLC